MLFSSLGLLLAGVYTRVALCTLLGREEYTVVGQPSHYSSVYIKTDIPTEDGDEHVPQSRLIITLTRMQAIQGLAIGIFKPENHVTKKGTPPLRWDEIIFGVWTEHWKKPPSDLEYLRFSLDVIEKDGATKNAVEQCKTSGLVVSGERIPALDLSGPSLSSTLTRKEQLWKILRSATFSEIVANVALRARQRFSSVSYHDEYGLEYFLERPEAQQCDGAGPSTGVPCQFSREPWTRPLNQGDRHTSG